MPGSARARAVRAAARRWRGRQRGGSDRTSPRTVACRGRETPPLRAPVDGDRDAVDAHGADGHRPRARRMRQFGARARRSSAAPELPNVIRLAAGGVLRRAAREDRDPTRRRSSATDQLRLHLIRRAARPRRHGRPRRRGAPRRRGRTAPGCRDLGRTPSCPVPSRRTRRGCGSAGARSRSGSSRMIHSARESETFGCRVDGERPAGRSRTRSAARARTPSPSDRPNDVSSNHDSDAGGEAVLLAVGEARERRISAVRGRRAAACPRGRCRTGATSRRRPTRASARAVTVEVPSPFEAELSASSHVERGADAVRR